MIIGFDVDEPIYAWCDAAHRLCVREGYAPEGPTPPSWHPYKFYPGGAIETWYDVLAKGALDGSLYADDPVPGVVEQIQRVRDAGHTIVLGTARGAFRHGARIRALTHVMLEKYKIPHDAIIFTADKSLIKADFFLDDRVSNVMDIWKNGLDCEPVLLRVPHNQDETWIGREVNSLEEYVDMVLSY